MPPPPPDEIVYVDRPVLMFSDPDFDFAPPPPPPVFFLPPPPPDFVVLEPPPPPIGLFILPQPFFVPIPVYVRAPVYVAPPPNNIIFANIHNTTVINTVINRPAQAAPGGSARRRRAASVGCKDDPGAGRRGRGGSRIAARGGTEGLADSARQTAGAAERLGQSGGQAWDAGRAGPEGCPGASQRGAERAARGPGAAEGQCLAGSRRQGGTARTASGFRACPRRADSERQAHASEPAGSDCSGDFGPEHPGGCGQSKDAARNQCAGVPGGPAKSRQHGSGTRDKTRRSGNGTKTCSSSTAATPVEACTGRNGIEAPRADSDSAQRAAAPGSAPAAPATGSAGSEASPASTPGRRSTAAPTSAAGPGRASGTSAAAPGGTATAARASGSQEVSAERCKVLSAERRVSAARDAWIA